MATLACYSGATFRNSPTLYQTLLIRRSDHAGTSPKRPVYGQLYDWFLRSRTGEFAQATDSPLREAWLRNCGSPASRSQLHTDNFSRGLSGDVCRIGTCVARAIPDEALNPAIVARLGTPSEAVNKPIRRKVSTRASVLLPQPWRWLPPNRRR